MYCRSASIRLLVGLPTPNCVTDSVTMRYQWTITTSFQRQLLGLIFFIPTIIKPPVIPHDTTIIATLPHNANASYPPHRHTIPNEYPMLSRSLTRDGWCIQLYYQSSSHIITQYQMNINGKKIGKKWGALCPDSQISVWCNNLNKNWHKRPLPSLATNGSPTPTKLEQQSQ